MAEPRQAYPFDHPVYEWIRQVCGACPEFADVEFGPLYGEIPEVLSLTVNLAVAGNDDLTRMIVWRARARKTPFR